ncbi:MAG: D-aminoacylase [Calditrichaeota bacterium]|nr:D-aminoacylase [Calditrichota bacterium]
MKRRDFIRTTSLSALGSIALGSNIYATTAKADLLIKNATIVDGTGGPLWKSDLLIKGDIILDIGSFEDSAALQTIDGAGKYLSPGFIDMHSHSDDNILLYPYAESRITQGITSEVTGNCGYSAAPMIGIDRDKRMESFRKDGVTNDWTDVTSYCNLFDGLGTSVNHALLLGHGTLRRNAVGLVDRNLTDDELKNVINALEQGMEQGAFGFSSGLEYTPGMYAPTEELIALARVTARHGGLHATHMRDEETLLLEAISEALTIARESGVRLEISHLKASGKPNWSKQISALNMIESARRDGVDVMVDAYPYTAFSTTLTTFLPGWSREGGSKKLAERLADEATRDKIRKEVHDKVLFDLGGYALIVISSVDNNTGLIGMNLQDIAIDWNVKPVDALLQVLEKEDFEVGFVGHGMKPENVEMVLSHPLVMIGSDGSARAPYGPEAKNRPHPRSYGTSARVIGYYCRDRKIFDLPTAIKKMTSMPADQIGLHDRGRIAKGMKADLVLFDFGKVNDTATFTEPHQYATGFEFVFVNGKAVIANSQITKKGSGKMLRFG